MYRLWVKSEQDIYKSAGLGSLEVLLLNITWIETLTCEGKYGFKKGIGHLSDLLQAIKNRFKWHENKVKTRGVSDTDTSMGRCL